MIISMQYGMPWEANGRMKIDMAAWFRDSHTMRDFKNLLRIAQQSDREHGTDAVNALEAAILEEQGLIQQEKANASEMYEAELAGIKREYEAKLDAALEKHRKKFIREQHRNIKQMELTEKMLGLLEEVHNA